jgi:hypothetical protein
VNTKTLDERLRARGRKKWSEEVAAAKMAARGVLKRSFADNQMRVDSVVRTVETDGKTVPVSRMSDVFTRLFDAIEAAGQTAAEEAEIEGFLKDFDGIKSEIENVVGELTREE